MLYLRAMAVRLSPADTLWVAALLLAVDVFWRAGVCTDTGWGLTLPATSHNL